MNLIVKREQVRSPCLNILIDVSVDVNSFTLFEVDIYYKEA